MQLSQHGKLSAAFGVLLLGCFVITTAQGTGATPTPEKRFSPPRLDSSELPATGSQQTLLHISAFGRYTILAKSAQGTALQLVDRMSGPGAIKGQAGGEDGRLDLFLERGDYKLLTRAAESGSGKVALAVHRAQEMSAKLAPRLVEFRLERNRLEDLQQRSYWLKIEKRRTVAIEAAGRNLADLRLWKDGNWLVEAEPSSDVITPTKGKPLGHRLLVADLNPGLYLLSAYGGPEQPWAESSTEHPFYLRMGIPKLGGNERRRHITSPFGIDRWLVPEGPDYFRLELPSAEGGELGLRRYDESRPFADAESTATVTKKSIPPVAELRGNRGSGWRILSIKREAATSYTLQFFDESHYRTIEGNNSENQYWVETVHAGHAEDNIDATAILTRYRHNHSDNFNVVSSTAIPLDTSSSWNPLDSASGWMRRFNLLDNATLFFEVKTKGNYRFSAEGVKPSMRIEPFFIAKPRHYEAPPFVSSPLEKELDPGLYVLSLSAAAGDKGIVTLNAGPVGANIPEENSDARVAFLAPDLSLASNTTYRIDLNTQPGVAHGIIVRRLPIDLAESLPVAQAAHQSITTRIKLTEKGKVSAIGEDGQRIKFSIGKGEPVSEQQLGPGTYTITIENKGDHPLNYAIAALPQSVDPDYPQPPITDQELNSRPILPELDPQHPYIYETARGQSTSVNIVVPEDALYRLESTGLLQTSGKLRTRTITSFDSQSANGVGRNFLIAQYLRQGDYQLTAKPEGQSRGPLSLRLASTILFDGGMLTASIPARHTLRAGDGLVYRFHVERAGQYRLRTLGMGRRFTARLEDGEGWPLLAPGVNADLNRWFEPGDYRYIVLPQSVEARAVTLFAPVESAPSFEGHGPHPIGLGERISHTWLEPQQGETRTPDQWAFEVPAKIDATIAMSAEMTGVLLREGKVVAELDGGKGRSVPLSAGTYTLTLQSERPNNLLEYWLRIDSKQLIAGQRRQVTAPVELDVAIGSNSPFELSSFGVEDVRARLYDAEGSLLASSDDRPDDWNFLIAAQLAPGNYRLSVAPVASRSATTELSLRVPESVEENPLSLPAHYEVSDSRLHYYPLPAIEGGELWAFGAQSDDEIGLAIERHRGGQWHTLGQMDGKSGVVIVPVAVDAKAGAYRLRVWSVTRRGHPIRVSGNRFAIKSQDEAVLTAGGVTLTPLKGIVPKIGVAAVELKRAGQFLLDGKSDDLLWGGAPEQGLSAPYRARLSASSNTLWLAGTEGSRLSASRQVLGVKGALAMTLPQGASTVLDIEPASTEGVTQILLAASPIGLPGVRDWPQNEGMGNVGVGARSSVLIKRSSKAASVALWGSSEEFLALPLQVSLFEFAEHKPKAVGVGGHDLGLKASASLGLKLPAGGKRLKLTLPAGVVAELRSDSAPLATYWSESSPLSFSVDSSAQRLTLYNTRPQAARAALLVMPAEEGAATLTSRAFAKRLYAAAGIDTLELRLSEQERREGRVLHLAGAQLHLTAMENSGRIVRGEGITLHDDARLQIAHGPGPLTAWLSDAQGNSAIHTDGAAQELKLPVQLPLKGEAAVFSLQVASAGAVILSVDAPVIIRLRSPGIAERIQLFDGAARLPLYLAKGDHTLFVESSASGPLAGSFDAYPLTIDELSEGLSERRMLAPGDARFYHFHLQRQGRIGVGAKASLDTLNCTLFDGQGSELGSGLLQMHTLEAGDYLLRVEAPADGESIEVQAALVGVTPPDSGPPEEVIKRYLKSAGLKNN